VDSCALCRYGVRNTGVVIPVDGQPWFCRRTEPVRDPAVRAILEPLLLRLSRCGQCPCHLPHVGAAAHDAYLTQDLTDLRPEPSAYLAAIVELSE